LLPWITTGVSTPGGGSFRLFLGFLRGCDSRSSGLSMPAIMPVATRVYVPGQHRWIADAIDDGLGLFAIVETVKTGWVFRRRATFVGTRIVVLHDGR
jgi:hypothetical protein